MSSKPRPRPADARANGLPSVAPARFRAPVAAAAPSARRAPRARPRARRRGPRAAGRPPRRSGGPDNRPPGAARAKENERGRARGRLPPGEEAGARPPKTCESKRLPATDISALASMKNVAKCDTWCELQNPANHRIFERKLRPRPSGRGHACLGVTPPVAPRHPVPRRNAGLAGAARMRRLAGRERPRARAAGRSAGPLRGARRGEWWDVIVAEAVAREGERGTPTRDRVRSHRDPRSGGTTRRV